MSESPRPDDVISAFLRSYKTVVTQIEAYHTQAGAPSLIESVVLTVLHRARNRRLSMQSLNRLLPPMTKSGVTRLIDRMERGGLVERRASTRDRRVTYATITDKGMGALRDAARVFRDAYAQTFGVALTPEEQLELLVLMRKLIPPDDYPSL
jgi:DNA-binding MarR family transcriptional regulator